MWKDKVLTHISQLDQEYQRKLLEKDQLAATILMVDFHDGAPTEPHIMVEADGAVGT